jgi:hypothetical protein
MSYLPPVNQARSVIRKNFHANWYKKYRHGPCKEVSLVLHEAGLGEMCALTKPRVVKAATIRRKSTTEKMNFWRRILAPVVDFRFPLFEREEIEKMFSVQSPLS